MYWPNEPAELYPGGQQIGGRKAFSAMAADGSIGALETYPYRFVRSQRGDRECFEQAALQAVAEFRPDVLFVQHVAGTDLSAELWKGIRRDHPGLTIAYHEGDPFDPWFKRIDQPTADILQHADVIFSCGMGSLARLLSRHSAAPVLHMPHCVDTKRFVRSDPRLTKKAHALAMIGNCGRLRRVPLLYLPGGRRRHDLASALSRIWGDSFALYGKGWNDLSSARGPVPFDQQEKAIQAARISVNWDHFDGIDSYFSDRLPISLAAGVPHVTSWHAGYDKLLAGCPGIYPCRSVKEAVETCRRLLNRSDASLLEEGLAAREWVLQNLEAEIVFRRAMDQLKALHRERMAS